jgi:hypothetical protein
MRLMANKKYGYEDKDDEEESGFKSKSPGVQPGGTLRQSDIQTDTQANAAVMEEQKGGIKPGIESNTLKADADNLRSTARNFGLDESKQEMVVRIAAKHHDKGVTVDRIIAEVVKGGSQDEVESRLGFS